MNDENRNSNDKIRPDLRHSDFGFHSSFRFRHSEFWILILILTAAALIRFHGLDTNSLWTDEFYSLEFSCGHGGTADTLPRDTIFNNVIAPTHLQYARSIPHIIPAMELDTHPPLYPIVLRLWREAFGEDAVAARSLSAILSVAAVLMLFLTVRLLSGTSAALWSAAMLAVAASQVQYAQITRSYAMLLTLVLACCYCVVLIEKRGATRNHCIALGVLSLCAMLTHYYAAPPLAALALYGLIRLRGPERKKFVLALCIAGAVWCIAWGPFFWRQIPNFSSNMQWILEDPNGHVSRSLSRAAAMPVNFLIPPRPTDHALSIVSAMLYILPLLVLRKHPEALLWWLILVLSVGLVLTTDLIRSSKMLIELRYTTIASAATCALLILLVLNPRGGWWHALPALLVIAAFFAISPAYDANRPNFRAMGNDLATNIQQNDAMVIFQPADAPWAGDLFYLASTHYLDTLPARVVILTHPANPETLNELKKSVRIWIVNGSGASSDQMLPGSRQIDSQSFPFFAIVQHVTFTK